MGSVFYGGYVGVSSTAPAFFPVNGGSGQNTSNEPRALLRFRQAGTFSKLWVRVSANTRDGTSSFTLRFDRADVTSTVSIGAGLTGLFEDTTHTDTISAGQDTSYRLIPGGTTGGITVDTYGVLFAPSVSHSKFICNTITTNNVTASLTRYTPLFGRYTATATEANSQYKTRASGTARNLQINVQTNSRADATTVKLRKNGGDGNQSISISASATGVFEDTSNTDTIASGDLINASIVTGGGTGTLTPWGAGVDIDNSGFEFGSYAIVGIAFSTGNTYYAPMNGALLNTVTSETNSQQRIPFACTVSRLRCYISANAASSSTAVLRLRKNGANGNQSVAITAGATGWFEDTTNTDSISANDLLNYQFASGASGGDITVFTVAATATTSTDVTVSPSALSGSFSLQAPSVSTGSTVSANALSGAFSVLPPSVSASQSVTISANVLTGNFSLLPPTVSAQIAARDPVSAVSVRERSYSLRASTRRGVAAKDRSKSIRVR